MPTSEARINANRLNAARSSGPKTEEGKARSRGNALKHGLTGAGIVLPTEDAAEVDRMVGAIQAELNPSDEIGRALARRAALLAVRMERCVAQETAALSDRVRQAEADFEAPEGLDEATADRLRAEAGRRAMFDPSQEATLARKYEAAAERGFYRALKELRQHKQDQAQSPSRAQAAEATAQARASLGQLGSFFQGEAETRPTTPTPARPASTPPNAAPKPLPTPSKAGNPPTPSHFDLPIAIGLPR